MIEIYLSKTARDKVVYKYTSLYKAMRKKMGKAYPRVQLIANIRNALSINGECIDISQLSIPRYNSWKSNEWKVVKYHHWYYAIKLVRKPDGKIIAYGVDALYEGDYHNDKMQTKPYESIYKIANLIERMNCLYKGL